MNTLPSKVNNKKQLLCICKIYQELYSKEKPTKEKIWDPKLVPECNLQVWTFSRYENMVSFQYCELG